MLDIARAYYQAGLCPLPRVSGSIEPTYIDPNGAVRSIRWGEYTVQRPEWPVIAAWFARRTPATTGIVLLPGSHAQPRAAHTAFLQILDIETSETFEAYQDALTFGGYADILYRCVVEHTPSGGAHLGFLCQAMDDKPKLPLARRAADNKILLELLQHQPCTVAPTCIHCKPEHPKGIAYTLVQGAWTQLHDISPAQRQVLLEIARSFNEVPEKVHTTPRERTGNTRLPGDCLNEVAEADWWADLLTRHGWKDVSRPGLRRGKGIVYFQRPGKVGREPSATYGATGPYLYVFSSNALPFEHDTAYSAFSAYTLLEHEGNFTAAARALVQQGYRTRAQHPRPVDTPWYQRAQTWAWPLPTLAAQEVPAWRK
jgi:putative DNA primase/helicase